LEREIFGMIVGLPRNWAKWKMCQRRNYRQKVGDYLNTIERQHHAGQ
jgi:hypothetical protein